MLYLSRKVYFSSTRTYRRPEWSDEKNQAEFGRYSSKHGFGNRFDLEIMVRGKLNVDSGIVVNTTDIKHIVNDFLDEELEGKYLNKEHPYFSKVNPSTENIGNYIFDSLKDKFEGCELYRIRLYENSHLSIERMLGGMTYLTRKYHFCSAHRLHSKNLSDKENIEIFGKCNNLYGHGHNYYVDVQVIGTPDPETGLLMKLSDLDTIVEREIINKFDHKHLNLDTEEFRDLNPTSEVLAMVIFNLLKPYIHNLYKIGVWETENNYFEFLGEEVSHV
jgi:6-pyruvoyltetrahydropterin/6-carboxytetrahydropterin synthase